MTSERIGWRVKHRAAETAEGEVCEVEELLLLSRFRKFRRDGSEIVRPSCVIVPRLLVDPESWRMRSDQEPVDG